MEQQLGQCFTAVFPELQGTDLTDASIDTVAGWDSTRMFTLIAALEESFGIQIPEDDTGELTSYPAIHGYLRDRL